MKDDLLTPIRREHRCPDCSGRPAQREPSPWAALRGLIWYRGDLYLGPLR